MFKQKVFLTIDQQKALVFSMHDIPQDFKIEHDRLIYEMEPIISRLAQIIKELPGDSGREVISYNGFTVEIKLKEQK